MLKSSLIGSIEFGKAVARRSETGLRHPICLEISTGTTQKVMLHLLADLIFRKLLKILDGNQPMPSSHPPVNCVTILARKCP